MSKESAIEHPGTVEQISGNTIKVHLLAPPACGSCHAKSACGIAEGEEKVIEVHQSGLGFHEGDRVVIVLRKTMGFKALSLGYVLPLILLLFSLFLFATLLKNEAYGALIALLMVGLYYLILYYSKDKINNQFRFSIRKQT